MLLYRISPLRAVAAGGVYWFILPSFTLFILLIIINGAADPALRNPAFHWLMPGLGFALSLFDPAQGAGTAARHQGGCLRRTRSDA